MNIGGLLTRSFGTGTTSFNQGERDALTRMRDRQAFVDEEEARQRRAILEEGLTTGGVGSAPGVRPRTNIDRVEVPPPPPPSVAPTAGVAPSGVTAPVSTILQTGPSAVEQIGTNARLKLVNENNTAKAQIQELNQYIAKRELSLKNPQAPGAIDAILRGAGSFFGEPSIAQQKINLEKLKKDRDTLIARSKAIEKTLSIPTRVAAAPAPAAAPAATQRVFATTSEEAIKNVLGREGGYVNNPDDRGGETKYGISKGSYPNLDIPNLTREEAAAIYKKDYWDGMNIDQLPPEMREVVFDAAVNQGKDFASKALQQSGMDPAKFLALREQRYRDIVAGDPTQAQFTGWFDRVNEFKGAAAPTTGAISLTPGNVANAPLQLGATQAVMAGTAPSNAYLPTGQANPADYSASVMYVQRDIDRAYKTRADLVQRLETAREARAVELFNQTREQIYQLDDSLYFLQGLAGLADIVYNPVSTGRFSAVMSDLIGQDYVLQPRSDGTYNEIVDGIPQQQGVPLQDILIKGRMTFDSTYRASMLATQQAQAASAIKTNEELIKLLATHQFKAAEIELQGNVDAYKQILSDTAAFQRAKVMAGGNDPKYQVFEAKGPAGESFGTFAVIPSPEGDTLLRFEGLKDKDGRTNLEGPVRLVPVQAGLMQ